MESKRKLPAEGTADFADAADKRMARASIRVIRAIRGSRQFQAVAIAAVIALSCVSLAWACNVPVFRFALERWRPDAYRAVVFHRGELTDEQREHVQPLLEQEDRGLANVTLRMVDVSRLDANAEQGAADAALLASLGEVELPVLVVQYPQHLQIHKPVWTGPPSREAVAATIDSPARKELVRLLAEGQTAVWLMLESGNKEQDEAAAAVVEGELKRLEEELELPELTDAPEDELAINAPLKIAFSLLRVRRDDSAEDALVSMLIHSEPDLAERSDPMVFPVYGRGRALWALIGPGITDRNIGDSAGFLVGPCSCEVKELNPGFDLLLSADWDALLSPDGTPLATVSTTPTEPPATAELVPIPAGSAAKSHPAADGHAEHSGGSSQGDPHSVTVTYSESTIALNPTGFWLISAGGVLLALFVIAGLVVAAVQSAGRKSES